MLRVWDSDAEGMGLDPLTRWMWPCFSFILHYFILAPKNIYYRFYYFASCSWMISLPLETSDHDNWSCVKGVTVQGFTKSKQKGAATAFPASQRSKVLSRLQQFGSLLYSQAELAQQFLTSSAQRRCKIWLSHDRELCLMLKIIFAFVLCMCV